MSEDRRDKRLDEYTKERKENVDMLARASQWNVNMLGTAMKDYENGLGKSAQRQFVEKDLSKFLAEGVREGVNPQEIRAEAANKTQEDMGLAGLFDKTGFFKEVEAGLENRDPATWEKIKDWLFKKALPNSIKKWGNADKFKERMETLISTRAQIEDMNGFIFMHRRVLSLREKQLLENAENNRDPETDEAIREDILERQKDIKTRINDRTQVLKQKDGIIDNLEGLNELWDAVRKELAEENRKIEKKFGGRVTAMFTQRRALIYELSQLGTQRVEDMQRQFQIKEEIHRIEVELEKVQKELIKYKARNPVFLFEKYLRHQSIDSIKGFGPPSDNFVGNAWDKSRGEKNIEGGGLNPPMTAEEDLGVVNYIDDKDLYNPDDEDKPEDSSNDYGDEPAPDPKTLN